MIMLEDVAARGAGSGQRRDAKPGEWRGVLRRRRLPGLDSGNQQRLGQCNWRGGLRNVLLYCSSILFPTKTKPDSVRLISYCPCLPKLNSAALSYNQYGRTDSMINSVLSFSLSNLPCIVYHGRSVCAFRVALCKVLGLFRTQKGGWPPLGSSSKRIYYFGKQMQRRFDSLASVSLPVAIGKTCYSLLYAN